MFKHTRQINEDKPLAQDMCVQGHPKKELGEAIVSAIKKNYLILRTKAQAD